MPFQVIFFDADDTLFDYQRCERQALLQTFTCIGLEAGPELLGQYRLINSQLWEMLQRGEVTPVQLRSERFRRLFRDDPSVDIDQVSQTYLDNLSQMRFLIHGSLALVKQLASTHRLAIITNGLQEVQEERIRRSPIGRYIPHLVISEAIGAKKPDRAIFEYALDKAGVEDRSQVIMVGDSLTADIQGGRNAGIQTCWYNPTQSENSTSIKPDYEIHHLSELLPLIG